MAMHSFWQEGWGGPRGVPIHAQGGWRRVATLSLTLILSTVIAGCGGSSRDEAPVDVVSRTAAMTVATDASTALPTSYSVINLQGFAQGSRVINNAGHAALQTTAGPTFYDGSVQRFIFAPWDETSTEPHRAVTDIADNDYLMGSRLLQPYNRQSAYLWHPERGNANYPNDAPSFMRMVNALGQAYGSLSGPMVLWDGATVTPIQGSIDSFNDKGTVIGHGGDFPSGYIRTADGQYSRIDQISSDYFGLLEFLNDNDEAAGRGLLRVPGPTPLLRWSRAAGMEVFYFGTGSSYIIGINDAGMITGYGTVDGRAHAFVLPKGSATPIDISASSQGASTYTDMIPNSINNSGHVVGDGYAGFETRGFIWSQSEGIVDLTSRLANPPPGLVITSAVQINDAGVIAARSSAGFVLLKPGVPSNASPAVGPIVSNDPAAIRASMSLTASFSDADSTDSHTALWSWGDGTNSAATVTESAGKGSASATHIYALAGVYDVTLTVTDSTGRSAATTRAVVVYDPAGGYVTGRGWINSPMGAYKAEPALGGRATFAFVSKYRRGTNAPSGTTDFVFSSASLNFHSEQYEWLVVGGARAQYKGTGTINNFGKYNFMLTAVDGNLIGKGKADRFRIKIWHSDENGNDVVDYDNQIDTSTVGTNNEGTAIGSGSIIIRK